MGRSPSRSASQEPFSGGVPGLGVPLSSPLPLAPACPPGPTHPDFPELPIAQFLEELEGLAGDLPHVFGFDREVGQLGRSFVARHGQAAAQPSCPLCDTGMVAEGQQASARAWTHTHPPTHPRQPFDPTGYPGHRPGSCTGQSPPDMDTHKWGAPLLCLPQG